MKNKIAGRIADDSTIRSAGNAFGKENKLAQTLSRE